MGHLDGRTMVHRSRSRVECCASRRARAPNWRAVGRRKLPTATPRTRRSNPAARVLGPAWPGEEVRAVPISRKFIEIFPLIPASLARLPELAGNLFFSWHRPTRALFEDLDPELWSQTSGNPRLLLRCVNQAHLERAAADPAYQERYRQVTGAFDAYLAAPASQDDEPLIAYFCAEFGFHESFPIYSGGLGILAGDHCKAASDLRMPFVGVGLLYRQGYFHQTIDGDGNQIASNSDSNFEDLPIVPAKLADGSEAYTSVNLPG